MASAGIVERAVRVVLAVGLSGGLLVGCGGSSPKSTFDLSAPTKIRSATAAARGLLVVAPPTALQVLDTERIVIQPRPGEVAYADDGQWVDRLPPLLQARIIQAFENASRLRAVGRPGDRLSADWQLVTEIRQFGVVVGNGQTTAVVELSVKLVTDRGGRISAGKVFTAMSPATTDGAGAAAALDRALAVVLRDLVQWATSRI